MAAPRKKKGAPATQRDVALEIEQRQDEAASSDTRNLLEEIREFSHSNFEYVAAAHTEAQENIRFSIGDQWDAAAKASRSVAGAQRPMLVFPKLTQYLDRVYGAMVSKRPAITVSAETGASMTAAANTASARRLKMSDAIGGMIRQIDTANNAQIAYLNAYDGAITWGFAHWRYRIDYASYSFDKVILIEPIWDPFTIAWDYLSMDVTNEDARNCVLLSQMNRKEFEREHPGAAAASFSATSASGHQFIGDWIRGDIIVVAEIFIVRPQKQVICELSDGRIVRWNDNTETIRDELAQLQVTVKRSRPHEGKRITWQKVTGLDVLEKSIDLPGERIPIMSVYGKRTLVEGHWNYRSLISPAKDEQRAYNYSRTKAIEAVALAPITPVVVGASQVEGLEAIYKTLNTTPHAYVPYNDSVNTAAPRRMDTGVDLSGIREIVDQSENGMMSSIGQYEASVGKKSNERSGRAVYARKEQSDEIAGIFEYNYNLALTAGAKLVMSWLPEIYPNGSVAKILADDGTVETVTIGREEIQDRQTGKTVVVNDLSVMTYAVKAVSTSDFSTRRAEAVQGLMDFAATFPASAEIIAPDAMRNMDFLGAQAMARKIEAALPPEIRAAGAGEEEPLDPRAEAAVKQAEQVVQQVQEQAQALQAELEKVTLERDKLKLTAEGLRVDVKGAKDNADRDVDVNRLQYERKLLQLEEQLLALTRQFAETQIASAAREATQQIDAAGAAAEKEGKPDAAPGESDFADG